MSQLIVCSAQNSPRVIDRSREKKNVTIKQGTRKEILSWAANFYEVIRFLLS